MRIRIRSIRMQIRITIIITNSINLIITILTIVTIITIITITLVNTIREK